MRIRRNQLTLAAVAFVLGVLVVVQLRAQAGSTGLAAFSTQDLTVFVANVNERNDQLRAEIALARAGAGHADANQVRGDASIDEIRTDLRRVRAYAGLDPVTGPGVTITVSGPIDGAGLEELINELRTGAPRRSPRTRAPRPRCRGRRATRGARWTGRTLDDTFTLDAIGASEQLTGSLTRSGGVIAQLAATQPDVVVTVTPDGPARTAGDETVPCPGQRSSAALIP